MQPIVRNLTIISHPTPDIISRLGAKIYKKTALSFTLHEFFVFSVDCIFVFVFSVDCIFVFVFYSYSPVN